MIPNCLQLPFKFNPSFLKKDLSYCLERQWVSHYNSNNFEGDWNVIALRAVGGFEKIIYAVPHGDYKDTDLLTHCPYFQEVLATFKCPLESVRLMRLGGQSEIKEHQDDLLGYVDGGFRLHIPIVTHPKVLFYFAGAPVQMAVGTCWFGNFNVPHRVVNASKEERIHLVIDCKRNAWSDELFSSCSGMKIQKINHLGFYAN